MANVLFSGCRSGRYPLEYAAANPGDRITIHAYDCYQARKIREDIGGRIPGAEVRCSPWLADAWEETDAIGGDPVFDRAFYHSTSKLVSAEFELDTFQDIYRHLAEGAELRAEGVEPAVLGKVFSKVKGVNGTKRVPAWSVGTKKGELKRARMFAASFSASVPDGPKLEMISLPGCFCHRRADEGGLALAEVICREAVASAGCASPVLDIGCGCGLVGLLVTDAFKRASQGRLTTEAVLLDSHSRAVAAARLNAQSLGISAECILTDDGLPGAHPLSGKFGIALANPPYYGEGRIADLFAGIAARSLSPAGSCWMVAKNPAIIREACAEFFAETSEFKRRGYTVIRAIKPRRANMV